VVWTWGGFAIPAQIPPGQGRELLVWPVCGLRWARGWETVVGDLRVPSRLLAGSWHLWVIARLGMSRLNPFYYIILVIKAFVVFRCQNCVAGISSLSIPF